MLERPEGTKQNLRIQFTERDLNRVRPERSMAMSLLGRVRHRPTSEVSLGMLSVSELGVRDVPEQPLQQFCARRQAVHQADPNCRQVRRKVPLLWNTQTVRRVSS